MRRPSRTSSSLIRASRPEGVRPHEDKLGEYKYLTLDPESSDRLTPYLRGVARTLEKVGSERRKDVFEPSEDE